jgi:beta-glucosidase
VPCFPFGHGLGYTTWEYQSASVDSRVDGGALGLAVVVRNTGSRPGREVVQAYVEPPAREAGPRSRPARTLAAFATVTAEPGQAAEVRLAVPARAFDRYDEASRRWVRPPGEFLIRIGRSSADLRLSLGVQASLSERAGV